MKFCVLHIVILTLIGFSHAAAQQVEVCAGCEYTSIKEALQSAASGSIINLHPGVYKEHEIVIDKPLTLRGNGDAIIDGELKGEIITIVSDSVTVEGVTIRNVGSSYTKDHAAVRVIKSSHFLLQNLKLEKLFFGIYLEKAQKGIVRNNIIKGDAVEEYNSGNGIQLWYCENVEVDNNEVSGVRDGIYLEFSNFCQITNNVSSHNVRYGLHFMFSNDDLYRANTFQNNGAGVAVMFSKKIEMYDNVFTDNWGPAAYGVLLKEINDSEIEGNIFRNNTVGINIEGSNRVNYIHNDFVNNGWAIKSRGACYANHFSQNNFLYNSFDLAYNSKLNDNLFELNFWSNYTGYDLDENGLGDVPYRPVKLFTYVVNRAPESIILLRSLFVDIIDFSEKVSPVFTPDNLMDAQPKMTRIFHDRN